MDTIGPAAEQTHLARFIPEVGHRWLPALLPGALVLGRRRRLWASYGLEGTLGAEPALEVNPICLAAQHAIAALWIPEVRHRRHRLELAHV